MMDPSELGKEIVNAAYLKGEFLLRSGAISQFYFDKYQFESDPALLKAIAERMANMLPEGTEVLAGLELGGVPLATAISLQTGIPAAFVRKTRKEYGTRRIAEGASVAGRRICIIEDVITTGGQVIASASDLKHEGASIAGVLCVIWRGDGRTDRLRDAGLEWRSLFSIKDLIPEAK